MTVLPATTTHRFVALNGATVVIYTTTPASYDRDRDRRWLCTGCDAPDNGHPATLAMARTAANDHASTCRALPRPEQD